MKYHFFMEPLFTPEARKNFIVGITEIIVSIFEISSEDKRSHIMGSLQGLDDATLLEKKDAIDNYFSQAEQINKSYFYRLLHMEHVFIENEERKGLDATLDPLIIS